MHSECLGVQSAHGNNVSFSLVLPGLLKNGGKGLLSL